MLLGPQIEHNLTPRAPENLRMSGQIVQNGAHGTTRIGGFLDDVREFLRIQAAVRVAEHAEGLKFFHALIGYLDNLFLSSAACTGTFKRNLIAFQHGVDRRAWRKRATEQGCRQLILQPALNFAAQQPRAVLWVEAVLCQAVAYFLGNTER